MSTLHAKHPWPAVVGAAACALAVAVLALSIDGHPLYDPDEGRYARTTQETMAAGDMMIVPMFEGRPRLQKPPVIHWLQGASFVVLGQTERGARLPSVLFTILTGVILYQTARRVRDRAAGLIAAGLYVAMPLVVFVGRLSIIDPVLNFFWTAAVFSGYLGLRDGASPLERRRYLWTMFAMLAMGMLTKGPIALLPGLALVVWLACSGRLGRVRPWEWLSAAAIAVGPLLIWAVTVMMRQPEAMELWYRETVDRVTGAGDHGEPFYYYIPVVLAGFFPATALLAVPGVHFPFKRIVPALREGGLSALLGLAVIVPLVVMSVMRGKLATYALPLAAPIALAAALNLRRWLDVKLDQRELKSRPDDPAHRLPNGIGSIAAIMSAGAIGLTALLYSPLASSVLRLSGEAIATVRTFAAGLVVISALPWIAQAMWRRAAGRAGALAVMSVVTAVMWAWVIGAGEAALTVPTGNPELLAAIHRKLPGPLFLSTYGFKEPSLSFYEDRFVPRLDTAPPPTVSARAGERWVVLVDEEELEAFMLGLGAPLEPVMAWRRARGMVHVFAQRPVVGPLDP